MDYYELEDRGYPNIYHWLILMLGGLRHIDTTNGPVHISIPAFLMKDHKWFINGETTTDYLRKQGYHLESLDIIKDIYTYTEPTSGACIQRLFGEPMLGHDRVHPDTYVFLRNLFSSRIPVQVVNEKKFIYITRKNSHINNAGSSNATRQILNEEDILPGLRALGFEILQFEDVSFKKKIEYFQTSSLIVSPNSAGLTFALFADKRSTVIEIRPEEGAYMDHYKYICSALDIPFKRFTDVTVTNGPPTVGSTGWNMIINRDSFLQCITELVDNLKRA